jgi:hypothetical protein
VSCGEPQPCTASLIPTTGCGRRSSCPFSCIVAASCSVGLPGELFACSISHTSRLHSMVGNAWDAAIGSESAQASECTFQRSRCISCSETCPFLKRRAKNVQPCEAKWQGLSCSCLLAACTGKMFRSYSGICLKHTLRDCCKVHNLVILV